MDLQVKNYYFYKYNIYLIRSTIIHRKINYRMRYPQHRLSFKAIDLKKKAIVFYVVFSIIFLIS